LLIRETTEIVITKYQKMYPNFTSTVFMFECVFVFHYIEINENLGPAILIYIPCRKKDINGMKYVVDGRMGTLMDKMPFKKRFDSENQIVVFFLESQKGRKFCPVGQNSLPLLFLYLTKPVGFL